jgi:hypothetical protein
MRILSLGAGVQSTTLYLTEEWDYAIFADTMEEPTPVYHHLEWLETTGRAPIIRRSKGRLGTDVIRGVNTTRNSFVSVPFYTLLPGREDASKTRRQCTREYKLDVIHQAVREILGLQKRQRFPKDVQIVQGIGFSYDEQGRIGRCIANWKRPQIMPIFPLYLKRWTRWHCVEWLRKNVPHEVPRSSCVFCPFHRNDEWRWLKANDPAGWERACQVDMALRIPGVIVNRNMNAQMFAHRSCVPLDKVDLAVDDSQQEMSFEGCTGGCAA